MLELLAAIAIALLPFLVVAGLLVVAERVQRRRERVTARQVSITWGPWRVVIPVRFEDPGFASHVLAVAHRALAGSSASFQIVLVPQVVARGQH